MQDHGDAFRNGTLESILATLRNTFLRWIELRCELLRFAAAPIPCVGMLDLRRGGSRQHAYRFERGAAFGAAVSLLDHVFQRYAIKHLQISVGRRTQYAFERAKGRIDALISILIEALRHEKIRLGTANYRSDLDFSRLLAQLESSITAAYGFDDTQNTKLMHDFRQVVLCNPMHIRDVLNRNQLVTVDGKVHQGTQCVVGICGQSHGVVINRLFKKHASDCVSCAIFSRFEELVCSRNVKRCIDFIGLSLPDEDFAVFKTDSMYIY